MFGTLKNILEEEWYNNEENYVIDLITEKEDLEAFDMKTRIITGVVAFILFLPFLVFSGHEIGKYAFSNDSANTIVCIRVPNIEYFPIDFVPSLTTYLSSVFPGG